MMAGTAMAKRNDVSVKLDVKAAELARKAAALKEMSVAEYLSKVVAAAATTDLQSEMRKLGGKLSNQPEKAK